MQVFAALGYASTTRFPDADVSPATRVARALTLRVKAGDVEASATVARWLFNAFPALSVQLPGAVFCPLPSSRPGLPPMAFARALAAHVPGATAQPLVARSTQVPSSRLLRRRGLQGLTLEQHLASMTAVDADVVGAENAPLVLVDDVLTTGATAEAALRLLPHRRTNLIVAAHAVDEPTGGEHRCTTFDIESRKRRIDLARCGAFVQIAARGEWP